MLLIGTSGWQYKEWGKIFYPPELRPPQWLAYYAKYFRTVEINNVFYRLPGSDTFRRWARETPEDFIFSLKMSRYVTHVKRLKDSEEPVARFMKRALLLGTKLGAVLLQLPPTLKVDEPALDRTLKLFRKKARIAVEMRHPSWFTDRVRAILEKHGAALCMADRESKPVTPLWRTTDWAYVRLHEGSAKPGPCYAAGTLSAWVGRLSERWSRSSVEFVFFNNDAYGCAVRDAALLASVAKKAGLKPTRTPPM